MLIVLVLLAAVTPLVVVDAQQDWIALPKLVTTAAFTGVALVWGAVLLARERWWAGRWPVALWAPVGAFVVVNVLALIFAVDWRWSLMGSYFRYQGLGTTLLYVLLFVVAAVAVRHTRDLRWLLLGLFVGALGASVYALMQKGGLAWWPEQLPDRPGSTVSQENANAFGAFLVAASSASGFLVLSAKARWQQVVLGAGVVVMLIALGFTVSRSAYLAMGVVVLLWGVAGLIWWVRSMRERGLRLAVSLVVGAGAAAPLILFPIVVFAFDVSLAVAAAYLIGSLALLLMGIAVVELFIPTLEEGDLRLGLRLGGGAALLAPMVIAAVFIFFVGLPQGRVAVTSETNDEAVQGRLTLWRMGLEMTGDAPIFGHGQDAFTILFASYRDAPNLAGIGTKHVAPESTHNFFIDLAVGTGVLGLVAFLGLVGSALGHTGWRMLTTDDGQLRLGLIAVSIAAVGYLTAVALGFSEAMTSWVFWLLLGATVGLVVHRPEGAQRGNPEPDEPAPEPGGLASGLAAAALALVAVVVLGWAATLTAADLAAGQAEGSQNRLDAARLFGRAASLNPVQHDYLRQQAQAYQQSASGSFTTDESQREEQAETLRRAIELYESLLDRYEPQAFDMWLLAQTHRSLARVEDRPIEESFPFFEQAVALDPYNGVLRRQLIGIYEDEGFDERAQAHEEVFRCFRAIKLNLREECDVRPLEF